MQVINKFHFEVLLQFRVIVKIFPSFVNITKRLLWSYIVIIFHIIVVITRLMFTLISLHYSGWRSRSIKVIIVIIVILFTKYALWLQRKLTLQIRKIVVLLLLSCLIQVTNQLFLWRSCGCRWTPWSSDRFQALGLHPIFEAITTLYFSYNWIHIRFWVDNRETTRQTKTPNWLPT